ncbi:MAG: RHS repeat domain-containing protein [Nitrospiraceae bacterium]
MGRLVAVVDGQGNAAIYNYDAVGNMLSITRSSSTGGGAIGIFVFVPSSGLVGAPVNFVGLASIRFPAIIKCGSTARSPL